ncbi:MAG: dockerin type I domain-containing protein [Planctomycetota bacterium]|nr:dockerin type I domain-containing protein [Planctomycetota bacterium]
MGAGNKATIFNGSPEWTHEVTHPGATGNGVEGSYPSGTPAVYNTPALSAEAWVYIPQFASGWGTETVMAGRAWRLGFQSPTAGNGDPNGVAGRLHALVDGANGGVDFLGEFSLTAQAWHQIGMSYDGTTGTVNFFIDGAAAGSQASYLRGILAADNTGTNNTFNFGRRRYAVPSDVPTPGGNYDELEQYNGLVDEAVVWDHTRTAADFLDSWNAAHTAVAPANFTATPASPLAFGSIGVATASSPQTVTLTNTGGLPGDVTAASITGDFVFTIPLPGTPTYSVPGSGTAVYGIQLPAQTVPGSYAGQATFTTSTGVFTYNLTATVFAHAGDVNGDGQVSLLDYNVIKANFGNAYESGNHWADGDVNGDLQVGLLDFNIVKAHFGHTTGDGAAVTAVPEPATLSLLALAGLAALRRKR